MRIRTGFARSTVLALLLLGFASSDVAAFEYDGVSWRTFERGGQWWMASTRDTLPVRPGHMTVSFDTTLAHADIASVISDVPGTSVLRYDRGGWYDLRFDPGDDPSTYVDAFADLPGILEAVPAFLVRCDATPNDSRFDEQWGLENTGQCGGTSDADVDAGGAWDSEHGDTTVVVAVIDTGAELDHEDLAASLWFDWDEYFGTPGQNDDPAAEDTLRDDINGWDFWGDDNDPNHDGADTEWHGSHVAGIAVAKSHNSAGVAGVAGGWGSSRSTGAKLMVLKIGSVYLMGSVFDPTALPDAIYYAVDNGADIINMSVSSELTIPGLRYAAPYARDHGVLLVAASGTNNDAILEPASRPEVMAIGATDPDDYVSGFSTGGARLNLVAPGGADGDSCGMILSTTGDDDGYGWKAGTSMSAPCVCGAAALALSADPTLGLKDLWALIEFSCDDEVGNASAGWDSLYGWGRLNANTMLRALEYSANSYYEYDSANCKVFCPAAAADSCVISVTIEDTDNDPVPGISARAIWAESTVSTFKLCCVDEDFPDCMIEYADRVFADAPTDTNGRTTVTIRAAGGNGKKTPFRVKLFGLELAPSGPCAYFPCRSYDMNRDCVVDEDDLDLLASVTPARGDFDCDGDVDQADSLLLVAHLNHSCSRSSTPGASSNSHPGSSTDVTLACSPSPTRGSTEITYRVPEPEAEVLVTIYTASGRLVTTLVAGRRPEGIHRVLWDCRDSSGDPAASGI